MSDIFISYAEEDRPAAKDFCEALQRCGWSVWWDRKIPPGKSFDRVISEALDHARCVVVLWSEASVHSDWVKEEANEGLRRGILVPASIADVAIPLGFRRIQAARLPGKLNSNDPEFQQMTQSIASLLGEPDSETLPPELRPPPEPIQKPPQISHARPSPIRLVTTKFWLRKWLIWGPILGGITGFVLGAVDDGPRLFTFELFGTWVGGGAACGLLGGAVFGVLFGILVQRYSSGNK